MQRKKRLSVVKSIKDMKGVIFAKKGVVRSSVFCKWQTYYGKYMARTFTACEFALSIFLPLYLPFAKSGLLQDAVVFCLLTSYPLVK